MVMKAQERGELCVCAEVSGFDRQRRRFDLLICALRTMRVF